MSDHYIGKCCGNCNQGRRMCPTPDDCMTARESMLLTIALVCSILTSISVLFWVGSLM